MIQTTYDAASRPTSGAYTTDAQGRIKTMPALIGTGPDTLTWDVLGRLATVASPNSGPVTTYSYDPLDRLEKIVVATSGTTTSRPSRRT
jgi:YD repeat-containing protein